MRHNHFFELLPPLSKNNPRLLSVIWGCFCYRPQSPRKWLGEITLLSPCVRDTFACLVRDTFACGQMIYRTKIYAAKHV